MNSRLMIPTLFALSLLLAAGLSSMAAADPAGPRLAHSVFFTLKDRSPEARAKFVASCQTYLNGHEGALSFSVGVIADDVNEGAVSVRDFDVSLLVVFDSKASEAKYLVHPRHVRFVDENKAGFAHVRVFDSYVTKP